MPGVVRIGVNRGHLEPSSSRCSRDQSAGDRSIVGVGQAGQDSVPQLPAGKEIGKVSTLRGILFFFRWPCERYAICIRNRSNRPEEKTIVRCTANRNWPSRSRRPSS